MRIFSGVLLTTVILFFSTISRAQVSADFSASATEGCDQLLVVFSDLSTGSPTTWSWSFGDGGTSPLQTATHVYAAPGTYTVTLTASNVGSTDTETKSGLIVVHSSPTAIVSAAASSGCAPMTALFNDGSIPGDGTINQWAWDFGDGTTSTVENPSNVFTAPGSYTVSLMVTDDNGCTDNTQELNFVSVITAPNAAFTIDNNFSCTTPLDVTITNSSTGNQLSYFWDFGDGSNNGTANPPTHTYTSFGNFLIAVVVTDTVGCADTASAQVSIEPFSADFQASATVACAGAVAIDFTDMSSLGASSWQWSFGDGGTSTAQNPAYVYTQPGTFSVTLIASDPTGCADTVTQNNLMTINPSPTVSFTSSTTGSCLVPLPVVFTPTAPGAVSFMWDFGDGNTATTATSTNVYTTFGSFSVGLTITDGNGCTASSFQAGAVTTTALDANILFAGGTQACVDDSLFFVDISVVGNSVVNNWEWDFGNGGTSNLQNPMYAWPSPDSGIWDVSLIITTVEGCTDTQITPAAVQIGMPPVPAFTQSATIECYSIPVEFTYTGSPWADQYQWNFPPGGGPTTPNPMVFFPDTGMFDLQLIAYHYGCPDTLEVSDVVTILPPIAVIAQGHDFICDILDPNQDTIHFTAANSVLADAWNWEFDTANIEPQFDLSTLESDVFDYDSTGTHVVELIVFNSTTNCFDTAYRNIFVSGFAPDFSALDTTAGCENHTVTFSDSTVSVYVPTTWQWTFGTGDTLNSQVQAFTFTDGGLYNVKLVVGDQFGCTDSVEFFNFVDVKETPVAGFVADTTFGCRPLPIFFSDTSFGPLGAAITGWNWTFGDGNTSTLQNDTNVYMDRGQYSVSLTVTDEFNCVGSTSVANFVSATGPHPSFTFPPAVCNGDSVQFVNTTDGPDTTYTYIWTFGDGTPDDTLLNPFHGFVIPEDTTTSLVVSLLAVDTNGCDSTLVQTISISIPQAGITPNAVEGDCPPFSTSFNNSSSLDVVGWNWVFGDGTNNSVQPNPSHIYTSPGFFTVGLTVTNALGCVDDVEMPSLIHVGGPIGSFTDSLLTGSCNAGVQFEGDIQNANSIVWVFGDGGAAEDVTSVFYQYTSSGFFQPILLLTDIDGCLVTIYGDSVFIPAFTINADFFTDTNNVLAGTPVTFFDNSASLFPITSWTWTFGDGDSINSITGMDEIHNYPTPGQYMTTLSISDDNGCMDSDTVFLTIDGGIIVPNVFTPNGDGINDEFLVPNSGLSEFSMTIFNRYGELMFQTDRAGEAWTGRTYVGTEVPAGTYFVVIKAVSITGEAIETKPQTITLLR